jgi:hypothetical protein
LLGLVQDPARKYYWILQAVTGAVIITLTVLLLIKYNAAVFSLAFVDYLNAHHGAFVAEQQFWPHLGKGVWLMALLVLTTWKQLVIVLAACIGITNLALIARCYTVCDRHTDMSGFKAFVSMLCLAGVTILIEAGILIYRQVNPPQVGAR